jgi:acylphosphatase
MASHWGTEPPIEITMITSPTSQKPLRRSVRVRIEGRVQGVGFRLFVQREAAKHAIAGFVRNRRDGGVEAVFSGTPDDVDAMLVACRQGPRGSDVQFVKVLDEPDDTAKDFIVSATV